jgi:hypothetical protein
VEGGDNVKTIVAMLILLVLVAGSGQRKKVKEDLREVVDHLKEMQKHLVDEDYLKLWEDEMGW